MSGLPPNPQQAREFPPAPPQPPGTAEFKPTPPIYHRGWVYFMIFVVLGPLALPLLYGSPYFSAKEKKVVTVIAIFYFMAMVLLLVGAIYFYFVYLFQMLELS